MNPVLESSPKPLVEPERPVPRDPRVRESSSGQTNPPNSKLVEEDVIDIEMERLGDMRKTFYLKRQKYKNKVKELESFRAHLLKPVPTAYISLALQELTTHRTMVGLKKRG